jgi:Zn-dependent protease
LATLAAAVENVRNAVPPARVQWALFGWSALLFAGVGAAAWHWRYAVLVLLVIGIHEFGHYAAMRAFGYRNVHMLALPLVGGVTIGQETRPSAARRAWMSLMGPLPGIAIGWLLLWLLPYTADARDWIRDAALLFLGINYLNVLPIPPLDGARVLQAMLPPRWHLVQAGFIVVTCVAGMVGAALIGMPAIAVIAGLQLMTISGTLQNGRTLRLLLAEGAPSAALPRPLRLRRVLDALQRVAGPARTALARIGQAEAVLHSADQPPMRWWQRGLLAGVLAALLVVPVGAALLYFVALRPQFDPQQLQAGIDSGQAEQREFERAAHALALSDLVAALAGPGASAADADALRDAGQRIGQALPDELAALYRSANGVADEGVGAVEQIGRAGPAEFRQYAENDVLAVVDHKGQATAVAVERAAHWIRLGPADGDAQIYYDADPEPAVAGHRIIRIDDEGAAAVTDLRALLESVWITRQEIARANERRDARMRRARLALRDEPVPALLAEFPQPGLVERTLLHSRGWPPGVDGKAIAAAEQRIGRALPEDLKTLYRQHDGVPPLYILQIEWLNRADGWPERFGALDVPPEDYAREFSAVDETASNPAATRLDAAALSHCVVVATSWHLRSGDPTRQRTPSTWWCPGESAQPDRWISVRRATIYPSLHALLIDAAAVQRAARAID